MIPKLKADFELGEGKIIFPKEWEDLYPLLRLDLLKDWLFQLINAYNDIYKKEFPNGKGGIEI